MLHYIIVKTHEISKCGGTLETIFGEILELISLLEVTTKTITINPMLIQILSRQVSKCTDLSTTTFR